MHLSVTKRAVSPVLVQEIGKEEKSVYFVSKMFKGAKTCYQKIDKLMLTVITTTRKLQPYF